MLQGGAAEAAQRYRDVLKSCVIKRGAFAYATASNSRPLPVCLCGLWCTTRCSTTGRVRCANATSLAQFTCVNCAKLARLFVVTAQKHKRGKDKPTNGEFLPGFTKEDRLTPVITLVVYFGTERWDAPRSVHQMFDQTYGEHMMSFVPDYKINLLEPAALSDEDLAQFTTDFGRIMEFLQCSNDKQRRNELLAEGSPFERSSTSAALV